MSRREDRAVLFIRRRLRKDMEVAVLAEPFDMPDGLPLNQDALCHIRRHSPPRVLRQTTTLEAVLNRHSSPHSVLDGFCVQCGGPCTGEGEGECLLCGVSGCGMLYALAAIWSDDPEYANVAPNDAV